MCRLTTLATIGVHRVHGVPHDNRDAVTWQFAQYRPNCAGCHPNDYEQGEGRHTTLVQDQDCGRCHPVDAGNSNN